VAPEPDLASTHVQQPQPPAAPQWPAAQPPAPPRLPPPWNDLPTPQPQTPQPPAQQQPQPAPQQQPQVPPQQPQPTEPRRRSGGARTVAAVAGVAMLAAIVVLALVTARLSDRADELEQVVGGAQERIDAAEQRAADLEAAMEELHGETTAADAGLGDRVTEVEMALQDLPDPAVVSELVNESVFLIDAGFDQGSGFVIRSDTSTSYVVTNYHVVAGAYDFDDGAVRVRRGDINLRGEVVEVHEAEDLAVIEVRESLPALEVATERPPVGAPIISVGSPLGLESTVATGIVSAFRTEDGVEYLQFSAPVSPGNSGGPVVDSQGRVLGVTTLKVVTRGAEGLAFAVPVDEVCDTLSGFCG
jgi:putative serine protease PepD